MDFKISRIQTGNILNIKHHDISLSVDAHNMIRSLLQRSVFIKLRERASQEYAYTMSRLQPHEVVGWLSIVFSVPSLMRRKVDMTVDNYIEYSNMNVFVSVKEVSSYFLMKGAVPGAIRGLAAAIQSIYIVLFDIIVDCANVPLQILKVEHVYNAMILRYNDLAALLHP
jgi:hypothetical protein